MVKPGVAACNVVAEDLVWYEFTCIGSELTIYSDYYSVYILTNYSD